MAQFAEVLDKVRAVLIWAAPAEVQALLKGLVEEQIISETYSKSLNLTWLTEGYVLEAGCDRALHSPGPIIRQHLNQTRTVQVKTGGSKAAVDDLKLDYLACASCLDGHYDTRPRTQMNPLFECRDIYKINPKEIHEFREEAAKDKHFLNQRGFSTLIASDYLCSLRFSNELLSGAKQMQKLVRDNERVNKGNLENEEWLEQVEEAARRIAIPLWQHWDRGREMLLPLVSYVSNKVMLDSEAPCSVLDMEEEMELAAACRTLDAYIGSPEYAESGITNFTLDTEAASDEPERLCFSTLDTTQITGSSTDHFRILGAAGNVSPVEACTATETNDITDMLEGHRDVCWSADRTTNTTEDLLCLTADAQCRTFSGPLESSLEAPKVSKTVVQDDSFYSKTYMSMMEATIDNKAEVSPRACSTCCTEGLRENFDNMDLHWDATMQEMEQDAFISFDFNLPEDLSEYMDENYLDPSVLFNDLGLSCTDELKSYSDVPVADAPCPPNDCKQESKLPGESKKRKKRQSVSPSQQCADKKKAKRPRDKETDLESMTFPKEVVKDLPTTTTKIIHVFPSQPTTPIPIQFLTFPDTSGYQVVQLSSSPPVIRLPLPNTPATPTYILVPATSPPCKSQIPPLSPVDGAVAPVLMSSSPPGSRSDTASKAMSPPCALPPSPNNESPLCKDSSHSSTVVDIPQGVKDYIREAKAHMCETCQDMEAGLSLTSHYVDVRVSQREILRSGKNPNKCLDKELVITGDTDRQKSSVEQSQVRVLLVDIQYQSKIFESSNGNKSKHYILLFGNAGMGKTTLIRKLCLDWSKNLISQFDFVFLLDGAALTLTDSNYSLQTLLLSLSSFAPSCTDPEAVYAQILAAPKRVLIIFDGFDKLRDYENLLQAQEKDLVTSLQKDSKAQIFTVRQLYGAMLQRVLLPGCTLLLASRPRGTASQLLRRADSLLEVCGFTPANVETYLSQYFTDPEVRASALDCLNSSSYLRLLCWNPGLCRLVCMVLEQSKSSEALPRTLTGLCHQVLCLKMEKDRGSTQSHAEKDILVQSEQETQAEISNSCLTNLRRSHRNNLTQCRSRARTSTLTSRARRRKEQEKLGEEDNEDVCREARNRELLSQLSSLAWEEVKATSLIRPTGRGLSARLKEFGLRTGLLVLQHLRTRPLVPRGEREGGEKENKNEMGEEGENKENKGDKEVIKGCDQHILMWANPFLQSYMAAVHLSLSRTISDRSFLQTLPFQTSAKGQRQPQREELELTQQITVGLLFHKRTELQRLHSYTETTFREMVASKQALVTKHLEGLSYGELSPAQVLEACRYVYEASFTHEETGRDSGSTQLLTHLATNIPELLTFRGVPLSSPDVFTVQNTLDHGGVEGRSFCLDLEDSGVQICGLRALVSLNNIKTYRACIADVISLWEQLELSGEEELLQEAVSKFKIHPLRATQVCHIEHLEKLVNIHLQKRLPDSPGQSNSILTEGVPAVKELHKLEFELGPEKGLLALPKLWDLLPGLHNLQHLDLEKSKIGDKGAEKLANALISLQSLEVLNLSQNCIGDQGVKKLAVALKDLPKLHCLSLYSNVISDEGAESLAAVLPHMAFLTDLDVKYNKLTDVGAQSLGASLRNCRKIKTLRMWNQCIPYGVFERLQQQDSRILWH